VKPQDLFARAARAAWGTRRARIVTTAAVAVAAALLARAGQARPVPAQVAERRPLVQRVVASGRVMAPAKITLASLSLARVVEIAVREGDTVRAGQLLLRLDEVEARAALAQARGRVQEAAARLDQVRGPTTRTAAETVRQAELDVAQAERDLDRVRRLFDAGAASAQQLDQATQALSLARSRAESATIQAASVQAEGAEARLAAAALRQAQAAEAVARARLDERQVRAPCAGRVLVRDVEVGDVVAAGRALLVVAEDGPARLTVQPDEKNLAVLRVGQPAEAAADAFPAEPFQAAVSWIAPAVDPARGTVEVRLAVPAPPAFLRTDMTVSVNVEVGRKADALVVAAEAVRDAATEPWVLRIADGRAERRAVRVGLRGEGMLEIVDGLAPGDAVVLPSAGLVEAGARVRARRVDLLPSPAPRGGGEAGAAGRAL
jgi:HlyD family secretion protein